MDDVIVFIVGDVKLNDLALADERINCQFLRVTKNRCATRIQQIAGANPVVDGHGVAMSTHDGLISVIQNVRGDAHETILDALLSDRVNEYVRNVILAVRVADVMQPEPRICANVEVRVQRADVR